jgi:hypothetical protein
VYDAEYRCKLHYGASRSRGTSCLKLLSHSSNKAADFATARLSEEFIRRGWWGRFFVARVVLRNRSHFLSGRTRRGRPRKTFSKPVHQRV